MMIERGPALRCMVVMGCYAFSKLRAAGDSMSSSSKRWIAYLATRKTSPAFGNGSIFSAWNCEPCMRERRIRFRLACADFLGSFFLIGLAHKVRRGMQVVVRDGRHAGEEDLFAI